MRKAWLGRGRERRLHPVFCLLVNELFWFSGLLYWWEKEGKRKGKGDTPERRRKGRGRWEVVLRRFLS